MKAPNGYGNITKLSGKRRRPYWVRLTIGWDITPEGKTKQICKTLGYYTTRKEAMLALSAYHQNPMDLTKKDITFSEVWDLWSPKHFESYPSSERGLIAAYKRCEPLYKMAMKDVKKAHMQKIIDDMESMSSTSQQKVKTVFTKSFKYCLENDIVQKDYSAFVEIGGVKTDSSEKFFTTEELKRVFNNLDFSDMTDSILILLYTGMRIGELLDQRCEDIDLENRIIRVRGTKTKNADRLVPIHKDIHSVIERRMNGEYLIPNTKGNKLTYTNYKRTFFESFKKHIGVEHTPHALRHTFISLMDASGVSSNSVVLKRIVGHSNSNVSESYTHKSTQDLIEAIDKLKIEL